jgi:Ca2+-binding EF-hand superfamily protein
MNRRWTKSALVVAASFGAALFGAGAARAQGGATPDEAWAIVDRTFTAADANGDGRVDRKEADERANFLVGGLFFQADLDKNGVLSKDEMSRYAHSIAQSAPELASALSAFADVAGSDALQDMTGRLGVKPGDELSVAEAQQAASRAVAALFAAADRDQDGVLTREELHQKVRVWTAAAGQRAFAEADTNGDGVLSQDEFEVAMIGPLRSAFATADTDHNGQLSPEEMRTAVRLLADQVSMEYSAAQRMREPQQQPQTHDRVRP